MPASPSEFPMQFTGHDLRNSGTSLAPRPGDQVTVDPSSEEDSRRGALPRARAPQPQIGRFVVLHQLGVGGMGTVFAAFDTQLDRKVALKILHPPGEGASYERQRQRTLREAKALARVSHPRVVSVYEVGESAGQVYLAMEFVDGTTLRSWQSQSPRTWREVLHIYLQAGAGLQAAHQSGIVHRDFKPDNVLVDRSGAPRVVDFGIACMDTPQPDEEETGNGSDTVQVGTLTANGVALGTIGYMSPEQSAGARIDAASDQWSFCAALYEALYGYLPFLDARSLGIWSEQRPPLDLTPRPPSADSKIPPEIFRILSRGLSREGSERFPDMLALLFRLTAEYEQSAAAAALSRRTLVVVVAITCIGMFLLAQYLLLHKARIVPQTLLMSAVLVAAALLAGYRHRSTLRENPFHRAMWALFLAAFSQNLGVRAIFTIRAQFAPGIQVALEMLVWAGVSLTMALTLIRRMWWVPLFPLGVGAVAICLEPPPRRLLLCAYPVIVGLLLWYWLTAARRQDLKRRNHAGRER